MKTAITSRRRTGIRTSVQAALVVVAMVALPTVPPAWSATGDIYTVAGNGTRETTASDGVGATDQGLGWVSAVATDAEGRLHFVEEQPTRIRRVEHDGTITTIAGNGPRGYADDGTPALGAPMAEVKALAFDADGRLHFTELFNGRVRGIDSEGRLTTVAGGGSADPSSGGSALRASIGYPWGLEFDSDGGFFVSDVVGDRVFHVAREGTIGVVAGNGEDGFSGDGGPATGAMLSAPMGLALGPNGALFIADYLNDRVRRVWGGNVETVAGGGDDLGDDGHGADAALFGPMGVAVDAVGQVFIADTVHNRVRRLDRWGTITTVAGTGEDGFGGDGGPATSAELFYAVDLTIHGPDVVVADAVRLRAIEGVAQTESDPLTLLPPIPRIPPVP